MKQRARAWVGNTENPGMTAICVGHSPDLGLTLEELQSGKPIIGIARTGSDLSPRNRHHIELAKRVHDGIVATGGICPELPVPPIRETGKHPTTAPDRTLAWLSLALSLYGGPLGGVELTIGCDKTTPAMLMGTATVEKPAIAFPMGPMLNAWHKGKCAGTGSAIRAVRKRHAAGEIAHGALMKMATASTPSVGHCNTTGTATTMNALAEALGMRLPGSASIPAPIRALIRAPIRERRQISYETGRRIAEMVREDLKPSDIMARAAFENAIVVNAALRGSTGAPIHLNAVARPLGVALTNDDGQALGHDNPLMVNMQPAGICPGEDFCRAGDVPAVIGALIAAGSLPNGEAKLVTGRPVAETCTGLSSSSPDVLRPFGDPLKPVAGSINPAGTLFDSAITKTSVIAADFRARYLSNPDDPDAFEARAVVFDGAGDAHARIDDPALETDGECILVIRRAAPIGSPGEAAVANMRPRTARIKAGISELPTPGEGRQPGTTGAPSILNASPEAAAGGGRALLETGDKVRVNLRKRQANVLRDADERARRRATLDADDEVAVAPHQTPWQDIQRGMDDQFNIGKTLKPAVKKPTDHSERNAA